MFPKHIGLGEGGLVTNFRALLISLALELVVTVYLFAQGGREFFVHRGVTCSALIIVSIGKNEGDSFSPLLELALSRDVSCRRLILRLRYLGVRQKDQGQ